MLPTDPPAEAPTLTCAQCGAALPVVVGQGSVTCAHCGAARKVGHGLRVELVSAVAADADVAVRELRARWQAVFQEQSRAATRPFLLGVVGSVVLGVYWLAALPFEVSAVLAVPLVLATLAVIGAAVSGFRTSMTLPTVERLSAVRAVRCSKCGGVSSGRAGAPIAACGFCRSTVLVPSDTVSALLEDARTVARSTQAQKQKATRAAVAAGEPLVWPLVLGTVAAVLGLPLLFLAGHALRHVAPVSMGLLLPIALAALVWAVIVVVRTIARAASARRALEAEIAGIVRRVAPVPTPEAPESGTGLAGRIVRFSAREGQGRLLLVDQGHEVPFDATICTTTQLAPGDDVRVDVVLRQGSPRVKRVWTAAVPDFPERSGPAPLNAHDAYALLRAAGLASALTEEAWVALATESSDYFPKTGIFPARLVASLRSHYFTGATGRAVTDGILFLDARAFTDVKGAYEAFAEVLGLTDLGEPELDERSLRMPGGGTVDCEWNFRELAAWFAGQARARNADVLVYEIDTALSGLEVFAVRRGSQEQWDAALGPLGGVVCA